MRAYMFHSKRLTAILGLIALGLISPLILSIRAQMPNVSSTTVTLPPGVDNIVKLAKAGLSEEIILTQVKGIGPVQLNADQILYLNNAGVSQNVIRALLQNAPIPALTPTQETPQTSNYPGAAPAPAAAHSGATYPGGQTQPALPTAFGFYAQINGQYVEIDRTLVSTVFGLRLADRGIAVDGFDSAAVAPAVDATADFIVYQHGIDPSAIHFAQLIEVQSMQASEFNALGTAQEFFQNVYGVSPYAQIDVNLLRPERPRPLQVEPVQGVPDMYRLIPAGPLRPSHKYAFYTDAELHDGNTDFTSGFGAPQTSAILFAAIRHRDPNGPPPPTAPSAQDLTDLLSRPILAPKQPDIAYADGQSHTRFAYPSAYALEPSNLPIVAFVRAPQSSIPPGGYRDSIAVNFQKFGLLQFGTTLDDLVTGTVQNCRQDMDDIQVGGPITTTLGGVPAQLFVVVGDQNGVDVERVFTIAIIKRRVLSVVLHTTPSSFTQRWDDYCRVRDSYRLD